MSARKDTVAVVDATLEDEPLLTRLRKAVPTQVSFGAPGPGEIVARAAGAETLVTLYTYTDVSGPALRELPGLRHVATRTSGYSHIDVEAAEANGIAVSIVPAVSTPSVAEYTFASLLGLTRRLPAAWESVRAGEWEFTDFRGFDLTGKTLGVVGLGSTGRRVAELGAAFGMRVIGWSRTHKDLPGVEQTELDDLLRRADVVSVNLALAPETRGLLSADRLALMKPTAYLVNAARGGIVDEAGLCRCLERGALAGAALDVLDKEPPSSHQLERMRRVPNLLVTPHIAWHTQESLERQFNGMTDNVLAFLSGSPQNLVTRQPATN